MKSEVMALITTSLVSDIGIGIRDAFNMFWDTLWAMILGFALSGAVQAFVSREEMKTHLGNHKPGTVGRASVYGMISSSCSYAASAMTKSLFLRGADFVASMVFMFASTNLVVELGIVLIVLIGWQFALAEFVGGSIMIVLLVIAGSLWLRGRVVVEARQNVEKGSSGEQLHGSSSEALLKEPFGKRIKSLGGWSDAAGYTMSDLTMLRKEILIGFVVAGFLAALVPNSIWNVVFFHGHGAATSVENVIVGPFIALISFVCSIGNVPLAAALWKGGISFGGVVSFIFADLISLPMLLIYRKFYGGRVTLRLLAVFWGVMSLAGLITEGLFNLVHITPTIRPTAISHNSFGFNYTTVLDVVFLALLGVLYWLYKNKERFGGGSGYAKDVVCGMQVEVAHAPACEVLNGNAYYFCSDHCRERFVANPDRFTHNQKMSMSDETNGHDQDLGGDSSDEESVIDPVCTMTINKSNAAGHESYEGNEYWFCCTGCQDSFSKNPEHYLDANDLR